MFGALILVSITRKLTIEWLDVKKKITNGFLFIEWEKLSSVKKKKKKKFPSSSQGDNSLTLQCLCSISKINAAQIPQKEKKKKSPQVQMLDFSRSMDSTNTHKNKILICFNLSDVLCNFTCMYACMYVM